MGAYEKANDLAILAAGRKPQWAQQTIVLVSGDSGIPDSASDGVYAKNALQTLVSIEMREEAHRRTARVSVTTLDLAANYTVTIDGTACTAVGAHASLAALLTAIKAAIDASAIAGDVTATITDEDGDTVNDTVKIVGVPNTGSPDFTIAVSATGAGVLACEADPSTATLVLWAKCREDDAPDAWVRPNNAEYTLTAKGFLERIETNGLDRLAVQLSGVDGPGADGASVTYPNVVVKLGPCVVE